MSEACAKLHDLVRNLPRRTFPFDVNEIPENGIYFLLEKGELGHSGDRIVRVGTHTGANQLRSRLNQHFVNENKDRSIFRKNIGRALLSKANDPYLADWEIDRTTVAARTKFGTGDTTKQQEIEGAVTEYLRQNMSFAVIEVKDAKERLSFESKAISTLSHCSECVASEKWLGSFSPKEKIRRSGLWLVNELYKTPFSLEELRLP